MAISTILSVGSKAAKIAKGVKKASDYLIKNKVKRAQKTPDKKFKSVNTDTKTYVNPRNNRTITTQKKDLVKGSTGKKNYIREMKRYHYKDMDGSNKIRDIQGAKTGMSVGQAKIAAKAPPPNKIDEKDFKVLREEKAKGRGMGLQDEKVQPGKVMKARKGKSAMVPLKKGYSKTLGVFPTINKVKPSVGGSGSGMGKGTDKVSTKKAEDFMKRRKQLGGAGKVISATKIGKMLLPVVGAGVAAQQYLKSKMKKKNKNKDPEKKMGGGMMQKPMGYRSGGHYDKENVIRHIRINKKMGGGMMKKYSKGGGADSGRIGEMKSRIGVAMNKAKRLRSMDRLTDRDIEKAKSLVKGKMGGGMIGPSQRPGYSKGTMVKARGCKLGRTRPTKIT